jgi:hypothetical protein
VVVFYGWRAAVLGSDENILILEGMLTMENFESDQTKAARFFINCQKGKWQSLGCIN